MRNFNLMRFFKSLHGWLGMLILPWVVMLGFTGFYMNHSKFILSLLPASSYDESLFDARPDARPVNLTEARKRAASVFPDSPLRQTSTTSYHGREVHTFKGDDGRVIVAKASGHYWVKTPLVRRTYNPDGVQIDRKIYWNRLFNRLHETGWIDKSLGTWLVDVAAISLMTFGLTGLYLFISPRLRRMKNRLSRRLA